MVYFSKLSVQICMCAEINHLFADIYFANRMIISTFASDKENNNIITFKTIRLWQTNI